jgi:hypothetical protein
MVPAMHPLTDAWLASLISVTRRVPQASPVLAAGADMEGTNVNLFCLLLPSYGLKPLSFVVVVAPATPRNGGQHRLFLAHCS